MTSYNLRTPLPQIKVSVGGKKADLNTGAGGNYVYLCVKKDLTSGTERKCPVSLFPNNHINDNFIPDIDRSLL